VIHRKGGADAVPVLNTSAPRFFSLPQDRVIPTGNAERSEAVEGEIYYPKRPVKHYSMPPAGAALLNGAFYVPCIVKKKPGHPGSVSTAWRKVFLSPGIKN